MPQAEGSPPSYLVQQSDYKVELERVCARLHGPVCQIGARAQLLDTKKLNWRRRLAESGFIGADLEAGENPEVTFDICDDLKVIEAAFAPALAERRLNGIICAHLLEHLRRPWIAAQNIENLLAPGGLAFVQVPWVQRFHAYPDDFSRISLSGHLGRAVEITEWIAHRRRLRNLPRRLKPIYSDNAPNTPTGASSERAPNCSCASGRHKQRDPLR